MASITVNKLTYHIYFLIQWAHKHVSTGLFGPVTGSTNISVYTWTQTVKSSQTQPDLCNNKPLSYKYQGLNEKLLWQP